MGLPSLHEDIEEALRLAALTGKGLGALALSEATAAEVYRQEQIVKGLLKRCQYIMTALEDVRTSASEVTPNIGDHAYLLRTSLERANEKVSQLMEQVADLELRLLAKRRTKTKKRKKETKKKVKKAARMLMPTKAKPKRSMEKSPAFLREL